MECARGSQSRRKRKMLKIKTAGMKSISWAPFGNPETKSTKSKFFSYTRKCKVPNEDIGTPIFDNFISYYVSTVNNEVYFNATFVYGDNDPSVR